MKQLKFVKNKVKGLNNKDSAIMAGYKAKNADVMGAQLMKNPKIMRALDKVGLTDEAVARDLDIAIQAGLGKKATNSDSLRGLELASKLRGHLNRTPENMTQNNIYVQQLTQMSDEGLNERITELTSSIARLSE